MEHKMANPDPFAGPHGNESAPPASPPPPPVYGAPPSATGYTPPPFTSPMSGAPGMPMNAVGQPGSLIDRFVARFIDGVIVGVTGVILNIVLAFISDSWLLTGFISAVATAALYLGYFAYLESSRGQTIGKQVMKLKVFGPDHVSNPTLEQAARRNIFMAFGIAGVVPIIGSLLGGLATLAAVVLILVNINSDPQRQHWFDRFAGGTQVLKVG
ncbi:RDD family protein [Krasilnikovia cinnamomea]|nr:RDD family protein [Krasilnikovia cinnamomea]